MKKPAARKLEIFLLLALRRTARRRTADLSAPADSESEGKSPPEIEDSDADERNFPAFSEQLNSPEAEKFERLRVGYQNKSEAEKQKWRGRVEALMRGDDGGEDFPIDENVHRSRVEALLNREIPAIQKIVARHLPPAYGNLPAPNQIETKNEPSQKISRTSARLEKTVRQTFAAQFVALRDLPNAGAFDRLNGAQLARLVRFAGMREVAVACAGIKAVEAVAGFLRRFAPEDARAVAAQISSLPKISGERLAFAESLVQSALEIEPQPSSAMLDWLGIRLVGIVLCAPEKESTARTAYAQQKLPLETEPKLSEIIGSVCRKTPDALKRKIAAEIERLAETVAASGARTE